MGSVWGFSSGNRRKGEQPGVRKERRGGWVRKAESSGAGFGGDSFLPKKKQGSAWGKKGGGRRGVLVHNEVDDGGGWWAS